METEALLVNGYRVVRIKEDLSNDTELSALKAAIKPYLDEDFHNLALSFTEKTVFFSRTIAVLVQFLGHLKENDGSLTIIHPNEKILEMIHLVGLDKLMDTLTSEDELGGQQNLGVKVHSLDFT